jgi:hypothetical protein
MNIKIRDILTYGAAFLTILMSLAITFLFWKIVFEHILGL